MLPQQKKKMDYMREVNNNLLTVTKTLSVDHSLVRNNALTLWMPFKCRIMMINNILTLLWTFYRCLIYGRFTDVLKVLKS